MIPYFILLIIVVLLAFLTTKISKGKNYVLLVTFLVLVLFAGLRDSSVGTDTDNYVGSFSSKRVANSGFFEFNSSLEIGYLVLEKIARILSSEYWVLLTFIAIIAVYFYMISIYTLSDNYVISIFLFITLSVYLFFFNGARQSIAAAIFSFSIVESVKQRGFVRYMMWIALGFLFHKTIFIMTPFYFLIRKEVTIKNVLITSSILFLIFFLFYQMLALFPSDSIDKYSEYQNRGASGGGQLLMLFYILNLIFFTFMRLYIATENLFKYDIYYNLTLIYTLIFVFVSILHLDINLVRLSLYFAIGHLLIWPIIFDSVPLANMKKIFYLGFILIHLFFAKIFIGKMSNLNPYTFNWEVFY